jgi:hypothetical protein
MVCIPFFLPPLLFVHRLLGLRQHDRRPTAVELLFHLIIWSICFEGIAPLFPTVYRTTADPLDVGAYAFGVLVAGLVWGSWRRYNEAVLS